MDKDSLLYLAVSCTNYDLINVYIRMIEKVPVGINNVVMKAIELDNLNVFKTYNFKGKSYKHYAKLHNAKSILLSLH